MEVEIKNTWIMFIYVMKASSLQHHKGNMIMCWQGNRLRTASAR